MSAACEAERCARPGARVVRTPSGDWLLCGRCAEEWEALADAVRERPVGVLEVGAWLAYAAGVGLVLHGLALLVMQVELRADLSWLRWVEIAAGAMAMVWAAAVVHAPRGRTTA